MASNPKPDWHGRWDQEAGVSRPRWEPGCPPAGQDEQVVGLGGFFIEGLGVVPIADQEIDRYE